MVPNPCAHLRHTTMLLSGAARMAQPVSQPRSQVAGQNLAQSQQRLWAELRRCQRGRVMRRAREGKKMKRNGAAADTSTQHRIVRTHRHTTTLSTTTHRRVQQPEGPRRRRCTASRCRVATWWFAHTGSSVTRRLDTGRRHRIRTAEGGEQRVRGASCSRGAAVHTAQPGSRRGPTHSCVRRSSKQRLR